MEALRAPRDVLGFIDWVWSLQRRVDYRASPDIEWQADLSWDEMDFPIGAGCAPGEFVANVDLAMQLYWPGLPPGDPIMIGSSA